MQRLLSNVRAKKSICNKPRRSKKNSCHDLASSLCHAGAGSAIMALILNVLMTLHELLVPSKHSRSWKCLFLELFSQSPEDFGWFYTFPREKLDNNALRNGDRHLSLRHRDYDYWPDWAEPLNCFPHSSPNTSRSGNLHVSILRAQGQESRLYLIHLRNYRGISLLSISYKILSNILLSRLGPYLNEIIGDHQCGFQRNRSTTNQIFCIHQILE
jgi:hypothetical protein